jgi:alpha-mannosidase
VHIVPHTHDDAGWLKTVDQYYFGSAQGRQVAGVQFILDSVIAALQANPDRTFVYGEVAFFARWWAEQGPEVREAVRSLVASGRLSFVNGGWVQHDEAAAFWEDMLDQTSRGHAFLAATFGPAALPTVGWQIDPFGHSATQAGLLTGALGFDALFFGRADYQDMAVRSKDKTLEHVWRGEPSYGDSADVLAVNFKSGNYGPLPGFNFDWAQPDDPIIDNVCAFSGWNVEDKVEAFVRGALDLAASTAVSEDDGKNGPPTVDVIVPQGSDFQYAAAGIAFKSLDRLLHYVNADGRVHAFYSSPAAYVAARAAAGPRAWPLKTDDFFPYADCPTCVWSGYFSSRPALKRNIRLAGAELAAARQLAAAAAVVDGGEPAAAAWSAPLDTLAEAAALGQHHDAVSGTSQQHVACDYAARLEAGRDGLRGLVGAAMLAQAGGRVAVAGAPRPTPPVPPPASPVQWCPAMNASVCPASAASSRARTPFAVLLYNSLARGRAAGVRVPIAPPPPGQSWRVTGPGGEAIPSQVQDVGPGAVRAAASLVAAGGAVEDDAPGAELVFVAAGLPPLGTAAFVVAPAAAGEPGAAAVAGTVGEWGGGGGVKAAATLAGPNTPLLALRPLEGAAAATTLHLDPATGAPAALTTPSQADMALRLSMAWYNASDGGPAAHAAPGTADGERGSPSGAYIFRPHSRHELEAGGSGENGAAATVALAGPVAAEVRLDFGPWAAATVRTWAGLSPEDGGLEVEWTAGPLPADGTGREVVLSYSTDLDTRGALATDSNGRRLLTRMRDARPTWDLNVTAPVAGNFYPITAGALLEEVDGGGEGFNGKSTSAGRGFGLVPDRAQGAASLVDGAVEVMLHRRLAHDDARGVGEPLNETACGCSACGCGGLVVSGTHTLVADAAGPALAAAWRSASLPVSRPLLVGLVTDAGVVGALAQAAAGAPAAQPPSLPPNLHLLTLAPAGDGAGGSQQLLLRVAHLFGAGEHSDLSAPATVDLATLLPGGARASAVVEMGLAGARPLADAPARLAWRVGRPMSGEKDANAAAGVTPRREPFQCEGVACSGKLEVELGPMQVRTFLVTVAGEKEEEGVVASA